MDENFFRGIVFTQAAFVFLMTLAIIVRYAMKLVLTKSKDRALPWHIMLISASYLWATVFICLELSARWGDELTYRAYNAAGR